MAVAEDAEDDHVSEEHVSPSHYRLEQSVGGLYYVEDTEGGMYEIEGYLGDINPICQVFRAKYTTGTNRTDDHGEIRVDDHQVVALKLARVEDTAEFMNMRQGAENSFTIGPSDDRDNDVITANNIIVGLYKLFFYKKFMCISMPYMKGGSIRYNMNTRRIPYRKLPEKCIAVVLRETLHGLRFLHGLEKVHTELNAGNIFVDDFDNPVSIKLAYMGSTYFHYPDVDSYCKPRIWEELWDSLACRASKIPENLFWTIRGIYEPSSTQEHNYTRSSDIWNLGVTALELAFGPLHTYRGLMRTPDQLRTFLTTLQTDEERGLPVLYELFIGDPHPTRPSQEEKFALLEKQIASNTSSSIARKMRKGLVNADKKVKKFVEKVKAKALCRKPAGRAESADWPQPKLDFEMGLSGSFKAMVRRCLVLDPNERPTAEMLLDDPFFVEHQDADLQYFANVVRCCPPIPPLFPPPTELSADTSTDSSSAEWK